MVQRWDIAADHAMDFVFKVRFADFGGLDM